MFPISYTFIKNASLVGSTSRRGREGAPSRSYSSALVREHNNLMRRTPKSPEWDPTSRSHINSHALIIVVSHVSLVAWEKLHIQYLSYSVAKNQVWKLRKLTGLSKAHLGHSIQEWTK